MIQDIAPHRLDRTYVIGKPDSADIALCVRRGRVLLQRQGTDWALPRFGRDIPMEDALHVFSLDGVDCYLARTPEEVPEGMAYVDVTGLRTVRPMDSEPLLTVAAGPRAVALYAYINEEDGSITTVSCMENGWNPLRDTQLQRTLQGLPPLTRPRADAPSPYLPPRQ